MFELHPPGTAIEFDSDVFTVGPDGLWRNKFGQIPAGQVAPTPERQPPKPVHLRPGRMRHGEWGTGTDRRNDE